jgi:hypothetical protein
MHPYRARLSAFSETEFVSGDSCAVQQQQQARSLWTMAAR